MDIHDVGKVLGVWGPEELVCAGVTACPTRACWRDYGPTADSDINQGDTLNSVRWVNVLAEDPYLGSSPIDITLFLTLDPVAFSIRG